MVLTGVTVFGREADVQWRGKFAYGLGIHMDPCALAERTHPLRIDCS